jgi:cyclopropane-fatty-acyl-phospholipid synthase
MPPLMTVLASPHLTLPPPGIDLAREARTARSRFYPVTIAYSVYAIAVLALGLRAHPLTAIVFLLGGLSCWPLVEYLVHRFVLHRWFPYGVGGRKRRIHTLLDNGHGVHHLRPWDGMHVNGRFDSVPLATALALLSFRAPLATWPVFVAAILQCYVIEEWVHYAVHFHRFEARYFVYIRKRHFYHHAARGGGLAYGLTSGIWDGVLGTSVPPARTPVLRPSCASGSSTERGDGPSPRR